LNPNVNQTDVDDIIRSNEGKLKEKGGYHLATNFKLAAGRHGMTDEQARIEMKKQRIESIAQSGANSIAGMKAGTLGDTAEMFDIAINGTASKFHANNAPGAGASAQEVAAFNARVKEAQDVYNALDNKTRNTVLDRMTTIANNDNTLARSDAPEAIKDMRDDLTSRKAANPGEF